MEYRREIDGLRAIAVIPVILFHAGFEQFGGGFVGVDVFFVISGYLITSIILSEKERGSFSIINFYERRVRRILPALFLVMLVCLPFAWFLLMPDALRDFSQSLAAVSLFSSNILFWHESGYFGGATELKPLLHTWSLAVEEQYYVIFPLIIMFCWHFRKRWILISILIIGAFSLIFAHWGAYNYPTLTFFFLPTRAWELMIGASLAFFLLYGKKQHQNLIRNRLLSELGGMIGLILIHYSIFVFNELTPFPSFYALVPTLGTALIIIFSNSDTIVGKFIGLPFFVGIGLISYSAYLWHQPLFAFARHASLEDPSKWLYLVLSVCALLMAYLTWLFIEKPFRNKAVIKRKTVFIFAIAGSAFFIIVGSLGHLTNGFNIQSRTTINGASYVELGQKVVINYGFGAACDGDFKSPVCSTSESPEVVVWGDSFAMHIVQGIIKSNASVKMMQMTKSSCGPFFDVALANPKEPISEARACLEFNNSVRNWLNENKSVKYIVLSSPFSPYILGKILVDDEVVQSTEDIAYDQFIKTLKFIESIGIKPIIFSPPPANGNDLGACLVKASYLVGDLDICNFHVNEIFEGRNIAYDFLERVEQQYPVFWLNRLICPDETCVTHKNNTFIYRDGGHLSAAGSAMLGQSTDFYALITGSKD